MQNNTEEENMELTGTVVPATAQVITETKNDEAHVTATIADDGAHVIGEAVRSLPCPPDVVKDLLSIRVCVRCILRLFGVYGKVYSCSTLSPSMLCSLLEESNNSDGSKVENGSEPSEDSNKCLVLQEPDAERVFCSICLGILELSYRQEKESLVRKGSVSDFTASVTEIIKQEGHDINSFAFEISIPPIILANERAIWLYMKNKYGSELWFQGKFPSEPVSLKDALKLSITNSLETLLGVQFGVGSFHICLTYNHNKASLELPNSLEYDQDRKRRKIGTAREAQTENSKEDCAKGGEGSQCHVMEGAGPVNVAVEAVSHWSVYNLQDKVKEPCLLGIRCYRSPIYIGGRYLKYSRNVSQTRWIIDDERMGEASVEEIIGEKILPVCRGDNYKFHAAGREDIDVRMLGSGRPFLIEVQNARSIPCKVSIREMEERINNSEIKLVIVRNLKMVGNQGWTLMREGEAEKQKQYAALVWISRPLEDADLQKISSLKDMQILQRTPVRVLHRRSPLEREKIIHWMEVEKIAGSTQYFLLQLCTQAGTYIKEFVHGDLGRTHPSIGSILGCRAEILQLDVTDVKMDCFN